MGKLLEVCKTNIQHTVKEAEFNAAKFALMSLRQESKPPEKMLVGSTNSLLLWMVLICTTSPSL
jgi:hypothetical protein